MANILTSNTIFLTSPHISNSQKYIHDSTVQFYSGGFQRLTTQSDQIATYFFLNINGQHLTMRLRFLNSRLVSHRKLSLILISWEFYILQRGNSSIFLNCTEVFRFTFGINLAPIEPYCYQRTWLNLISIRVFRAWPIFLMSNSPDPGVAPPG